MRGDRMRGGGMQKKKGGTQECGLVFAKCGVG